MVLISTTEEIACSPAHLRKIVRPPPKTLQHQPSKSLTQTPFTTQFLDFPRIPQWTQGFIRGIEQQTPDKSTIEAGDKLTVKLEGMTFSPVVLVSPVRHPIPWPLNQPDPQTNQLTQPTTGKHSLPIQMARKRALPPQRRPFLPLRAQCHHAWGHDFHPWRGV
jgi:hypothetical protein